MSRSSLGGGGGTPHPRGNSNYNNESASSSANILRNIASFLTLSDAASLHSFPTAGGASNNNDNYNDDPPYHHMDDEIMSVDSWAVGEGVDPTSGYHGSHSAAALMWDDVQTPATPGLIALSPGATPTLEYEYEHPRHQHQHHRVAFQQFADHEGIDHEDDDDEDDTEYMEQILLQKRRRWAQQKLATAVFSHPDSIRSYCLDAYQAANKIRHQQEQQQQQSALGAPELEVEPIVQKQQRNKKKNRGASLSMRRTRRRIIHAMVDLLLHNLPVSILIDVLEGTGELSLSSVLASYQITVKSLNAIGRGIIHVVTKVWECIVNFNPFSLLETMVSFQFNAMEKTSEALATGIQSVATGMGSASSMALHRLSVANLSVNLSSSANKPSSSGSQLGVESGLRRSRSNGTSILNKRLLKKLSSINDAARVVSYMESGDPAGGLSKQARSKVQRMMHYDVSLRPFVATVEIPMSGAEIGFGAHYLHEGGENNSSPIHFEGSSSSFSSDSVASPSSSPFMCTPQSFPPTPHSRKMVMARGNRFADDVVYLARDRLRLHAGGDSENEKTREMAKLLREGKRLAVFNGNEVSPGIELSCGFHIATKVGNMLYASARSMVPVLRNCFVYFEMTVIGSVSMQQTMMTTLSIGLSTEEMPNNTLVGAWQGSCGLCTTGQILVAGQWCTPENPALAAFTDGATVGCLVCLDDKSAVDTWEGLLVTANVCFNVNGIKCAPMVPPSSQIPFGQKAVSPKKLPPSASRIDEKPAAQSDESSSSSAHNNKSITLKTAGTSSTTSTDLPLLVPAAEELYPTVTLHSSATSVLCRLSAEDVLAETRQVIGAPPEAVVYAVDGSVIFGEKEHGSRS